MVYRVAELRVGELILVRARVIQDWFQLKFWSKDVTIINWCNVIFTFRVFWWRWRVRTWCSVSLGSGELAYPLVLDYFVPRSNSINLRFTTFHWCFVTKEVNRPFSSVDFVGDLTQKQWFGALGQVVGCAPSLGSWYFLVVENCRLNPHELTHTNFLRGDQVTKLAPIVCTFLGGLQQTPPLPAHNCDIYDESKLVFFDYGNFWLVKNDVKITYHFWYLYL